MTTNTHETTIFLIEDEDQEEILVEVEYAIGGAYEAPSLYSPGDEPTLEVVTITVISDEADGGFDEGYILDEDEVILDEDAILQEIMDYAADDAAEAAADAYESRYW